MKKSNRARLHKNMPDKAPTAGERAALWRDWMSKLFFGLESDLYGDTGFDGHVHTAHAGIHLQHTPRKAVGR